MLSAEAHIETERSSRYLVQLCRHAAAMAAMPGHRPRLHAGGNPLSRGELQLHAEWSETRGVVSFSPWGQCTIAAEANMLTLRIEATNEDNLQLIQDILSRDLNRFGRRERLTVNWQRPESPSVRPDGGPAA